MEGLLIQGVGGIYKVMVDGEILDAFARGRLKKNGIKPVVGDRVSLEKEAQSYAIIEILPRKNCLVRPAVANVDQIAAVIAAASPNPNFKQTDKLLAMLKWQGIEAFVCINKTDLKDGERFGEVYEKAGYRVLYVSKDDENGKKTLKNALKNKVSAFAGCSGVGKSSLINAMDTTLGQETGNVGKTDRGKHTTTHARLLPLSFGGYIADTPGFSVVDITSIPKEELYTCFPEMEKPAEKCRFTGCSHIKEPGCGVVRAVKSGEVPAERYESYLAFYEELSLINKY